MSVKNIDKEFQINKEFLDSIDFIPFLKRGYTLGGMMIAVESYCFLQHIAPPKELENEVFNYFTMEDFKDYLLNRYSNLDIYPFEDYLIDFRGEK